MGLMNWIGRRSAAAPAPTESLGVGRSVRAASSNPDNRDESYQWRKLGNSSARNLPGVDHRKMVLECSQAAVKDGFAKAHIRLITAITVGAGEMEPTVRCKDEAARDKSQALLLESWNDPVNALATALPEFMRGLSATGSLCLTLHTGDSSRRTRIGYVDPASFVDPYVLTDPGNVRDPIAVLRGTWGGVQEVLAHPILRNDGKVHALVAVGGKDGAPLPEGSRISLPVGPDRVLDAVVGAPCMYLGVNRVSPNQTCGVSDLFASLDMLSQLDSLVFGAAGRSLNLGTFSVHAEFEKGTPTAQMKETLAELKADIESGEGRLVGTAGVKLTAIAAAIQAGEWATLEKMLRVVVLVGLGPWPLHAFSEAGGTNVTAAAEQGAAITNILLDRQNEFRRFLNALCWYMLRQYPEFAAIEKANPDLAIELPLPVIVAKDTTRESNVLAVETNTLLTAVREGLIELECAQRNFREQASRYGLDVTPQDAPDAEEFEESRKMAPVGFDLPGDETDDPRGGHREGEDDKVPEGTPRARVAAAKRRKGAA